MKQLTLILLVLLTSVQLKAQNEKLLIGTYTNKGNSEGIYVYDYDFKTAETKLLHTEKAVNPSYIALSPDQKTLYSVNESGKASGARSFSFDPKTGKLTALNTKGSESADPCFVAANDKHVILANYSGGSITVFGRNADGSLTDAKQLIQHTGKSIDPKRQTSAHVHQVQFTPDRKYLICNDLGEDQVYIYDYNPTSPDKILTIKTVLKTNAGSGPRHLAFSPNGKFAYLTHEFNGMINGYVYKNGNLIKIQEIGTAAAGFNGKIDAADIHVAADGKFLYQTNRGDANTISVFSIYPTGTLKFIETVSTLGRGPRNFTIDPNGNFLLVAHQYTNDVVIFNRNKTNGKLTDSGKRINVGTPVCLIFSK
jgi:6-phosphogluconolactonase